MTRVEGCQTTLRCSGAVHPTPVAILLRLLLRLLLRRLLQQVCASLEWVWCSCHQQLASHRQKANHPLPVPLPPPLPRSTPAPPLPPLNSSALPPQLLLLPLLQALPMRG